MTNAWSGRKVTAARAIVATRLPAPCGQCGKVIEAGADPRTWVVGHIKPRATHPALIFDPGNWRPEHRRCSNRTGHSVAIANAELRGARAALRGDFPGGDGSDSYRSRSSLSPTSGALIPTRPDLEWSPEALARHDWLVPFLEVPDDASPPLWMSPPPADAVGSYGADAVAWIEESQRIRLRWWQRLAITRQLEHRADGSLVHRSVVESGPRRIGKSVRIRGLALWRLEHGPGLFGETQLVMHTGSDVAICREIQRAAWRWAEDVAGWTVTRGNGKEAVETPGGDRWLVRAQDAVYGYDCCLGLVDEGWNVKPDTVTEGLEPATLERSSAQVHLTSTAHRRATSLMRGQLQSALTVDDPEVLLLVWAAPPGSDPGDPAVWRAASAHWSQDRRRMIASKYEKALAGQADPEADDPDPMAGFVAQYLNIWRLRETATRGEPMVDEQGWAHLIATMPDPDAKPDAAAIESWFAEGISVVLAWRLDGGRVLVSVTAHDDLPAAVAAVRASGFRGVTTLGASLAADPAAARFRTRPGEGRTADAVKDVERLLREDVVRHDGGQHLTDQVLAVRTVPGADGRRMSSTGRADAVKATAWAVRAARASRGRQRLVLPSA